MTLQRNSNSSILTRSWTVRLTPSYSGKSISFRFKPTHIILLLIVAIAIFAFLGKSYIDKTIIAQQKIASLNETTERQKIYIDKLQAEKDKMASLVEKQNLQLADKLRELELKNREVGKLVGLKVKPTKAPKKIKKSLKAKRGNIAYSSMAHLASLLHSEIGESAKEGKILEQKAIEYHEEYLRKMRFKNSTPSLYPAQGVITSEFGYRVHPIFGYVRYHSGMDIANDTGTPIYATASGTVTIAGYVSGYGNCVEIEHTHGISTLYGHCSRVLVTPGQYVNKGQEIAKMGSTGNSTGPHVHYELRFSGVPTAPAPYMRQSAAAYNKNKMGIY